MRPVRRPKRQATPPASRAYGAGEGAAFLRKPRIFKSMKAATACPAGRLRGDLYGRAFPFATWSSAPQPAGLRGLAAGSGRADSRHSESCSRPKSLVKFLRPNSGLRQPPRAKTMTVTALSWAVQRLAETCPILFIIYTCCSIARADKAPKIVVFEPCATSCLYRKGGSYRAIEHALVHSATAGHAETGSLHRAI